MGDYNSNQKTNYNMNNQLIQMMLNNNSNPMTNNNMMNQLMQMILNNNSNQMMNNMVNQNINPFFNNNHEESLNSLLKIKAKNIIGKSIYDMTLEDKFIQFLGFICLDGSIMKKNEFEINKIIINYYNIININVYLDLNLEVKELIKNIFWKIFYPSSVSHVNKRTKKNQTTEFIIKNPISEPIYKYIINYDNFLHLEFKGKNLSKFIGKTGKEIGIKDENEILLKLNNDFYHAIQKNLDKTALFDINGQTKVFWCEEKENLSERIYNIFNKNSCFLDLIREKDFEESKLLNKNIRIINRSDVKGRGGPPIYFIDVSMAEVKELKFNKNAPKWRIVNKGLNIFGICKNDKCVAFKKEVIYRTNLPENGLNFILNEEISHIVCPICDNIIKIKTCGFFKCEYQLKGKKLVPGKKGEIEYESKPKETNGDKFDYFIPSEDNEVLWLELNIFVLPKQKIKYQEN